MTDPRRRVACPICNKPQALTTIGRFRTHGPKDAPCEMSGAMAPERLVEPLPPEEPCNRNINPSPETNPAWNAAKGPVGRATPTTASDSPTTPATATRSTTWLPSHGYDQPDPLNRAVRQSVPMDELGMKIATMCKEIFYQYTNRSRRTQQKTLGPSQAGTACDRRLVMHLLGMQHVNPGGDNWASWVGTQIHSGLETMFTWADAGQGRFVTEMGVAFNSEVMPGGTLDLMDRVLIAIYDHKAMGQWSLDQLRTKGPSRVYRTQLHLYGMGARTRGEQVEHVALIGWPRDKPNLDDLYVWHEPYDPSVARAALERVDRLQRHIQSERAHGATPLDIAAATPLSDDCRFCPYHQKDAKDLTHGGCNGRA